VESLTSRLSCREIARQAIRSSLPQTAWEENWQFIKNLRTKLAKHKMLNHPFIEKLNQQQLSQGELKEVFLNFRPLVAKFTDVLLKAAVLTHQVEPRVMSGAKMYGRFLITLNVLDELGFSPDVDQRGYYQGSPFNSHCLLFEKVIEQVGISEQEKKSFVPCQASQEILKLWSDEATSDLKEVTAGLVTTEMIALHFNPALRKNAEIFDSIDFKSGYFHVHGSSEDENLSAADDDHEDDLWYVMAQSLSPDEYNSSEKRIIFYMEKWVDFWDAQLLLTQR